MFDPNDILLLTLNAEQRNNHLAFRQTEQEYSFFYDETNNVRKFYIKSNKFNCPTDDNFVLGGIFYNTNRNSIDFENLFSSLHLQKNINEVKLKHIGTGDFPCILNSPRLNNIFNWLLANNIYIHYVNVDIFYWGVVDIVDSVDEIDLSYNRELKDSMYHIIRNDRSSFLALCDKYCYPNIKREELVEYKREMYSFINKNKYVVYHTFKDFFDKFIDAFMESDNFDFIMDEEDHMLIKNFSPFYIERLTNFSNAKHILDDEEAIREEISRHDLDELKPIDFKFVDSNSLREIQLSDIIAGFLGKFFTYIKNASWEDLDKVKENLSSLQKENLRLFVGLVNSSEQLTPLSINSISSLYDFGKAGHFLHDA